MFWLVWPFLQFFQPSFSAIRSFFVTFAISCSKKISAISCLNPLPDPVLFLHKGQQTRFLQDAEGCQKRYLNDTRMTSNLDPSCNSRAIHHLRDAEGEKLSRSAETNLSGLVQIGTRSYDGERC